MENLESGYTERSRTLRSPKTSATNLKLSLYRRNSTRRTRLEKNLSTQKTKEAISLDKVEELEED